MDYVLVFILGSFVGMMLLACVVAIRDKDDEM